MTLHRKLTAALAPFLGPYWAPERAAQIAQVVDTWESGDGDPWDVFPDLIGGGTGPKLPAEILAAATRAVVLVARVVPCSHAPDCAGAVEVTLEDLGTWASCLACEGAYARWEADLDDKAELAMERFRSDQAERDHGTD